VEFVELSKISQEVELKKMIQKTSMIRLVGIEALPAGA